MAYRANFVADIGDDFQAKNCPSAASRTVSGACNVSCSGAGEARPWAQGATLLNYLNAARLQGVTGSLALQESESLFPKQAWIALKTMRPPP